MGGSPWNDATDRQLLLVMIHLTAAPLPDWDKVARMMGEGFTKESTRQHFQKMRKLSKEEFGDPAAVADAKVAKGTPRKGANGKAAGTNGASSAKGSGKRKAKGSHRVDRDDEEEEEDGVGESPSKKIKVEAKGEEERNGGESE